MNILVGVVVSPYLSIRSFSVTVRVWVSPVSRLVTVYFTGVLGTPLVMVEGYSVYGFDAVVPTFFAFVPFYVFAAYFAGVVVGFL